MLRDQNSRNRQSRKESYENDRCPHTRRFVRRCGGVTHRRSRPPWQPAKTTTIDPSKSRFTKWGVTAPPLPAPQPPFGLFEGFSGDGLPGSFVAEVLWRQASLNGHVIGLEAMYEVVDGDRSFTALIRGGSECGGRGLLRRRHPGWVANRRAGAGRVSEVSRYCRDAQLRGRTREQNVFRGNHPR